MRRCEYDIEMIMRPIAGRGRRMSSTRMSTAIFGLSTAGGFEAAADWSTLRSPENYVGYGRTRGFASPEGAAPDKPRMYELPARLRLNDWALSGDWTMKREAVALNKANGRIAYRFHARDLHLVMGPAVSGTSVRFRVLIDGQPPGAAHGSDVDEQATAGLPSSGCTSWSDNRNPSRSTV